MHTPPPPLGNATPGAVDSVDRECSGVLKVGFGFGYDLELAFIGVGLVVLGLSLEERPIVPLRVWVVGYMVQCLFHMGCQTMRGVMVKIMGLRNQVEEETWDGQF
ncbi:hypothetical protein SO802_028413 [Lithocarpus litseifolius]|uniref:Uncharacterized protein n=1 Tax=Lithocarpus litseifolius TaxID=425828 RepID=A0AAW2BTS9_9ROSI